MEGARVTLANHAVQGAQPCTGGLAGQQRDEFGEGLVQQFVGRTVEQLRSGRIRRLDDAGFVDAENVEGVAALVDAGTR